MQQVPPYLTVRFQCQHCGDRWNHRDHEQIDVDDGITVEQVVCPHCQTACDVADEVTVTHGLLIDDTINPIDPPEQLSTVREEIVSDWKALVIDGRSSEERAEERDVHPATVRKSLTRLRRQMYYG